MSMPRFGIHRRDVFAGGASFGEAGAYERAAADAGNWGRPRHDVRLPD